ncbi:glycosyltransferase family 2 protein [Flavobacterium sp. SM15]|uniref:glycosyltransferase family 2 protein n=1 Tax=Flavobacterium sp. SM15 TaxID=2908005 RepID=UPI001EDB8527|nr:glycosyltransferase family 2 protein [Flavobacterium sp. SM15]MCG2611244.1 glycosyltransferase family 2 protein [Flavobacterium sp. SM15]
MKLNKFYNYKIAVVIPYYNAEKHIAKVVSKLPDYVSAVIIVDDKGREPLPVAEVNSVKKAQTALVVIENEVNLGVGGATKKGFQYAIANNFDIVVKIDSDDQMDTSYLPDLLLPIIKKKAEMAKGNRFRDINSLKKMPFVRRIGNLFLSFLTKLATGYWNNFDPTNGFFAVKTSVLKSVDFTKLSDRYFFETSLIAQLYFTKTRIKDVSMPAIYADEKSSMQVWKMPVIFSRNLFKVFVKRIVKEYFLYDFNIGSLYLLFGLPLFLFGLIFGGYTWYHYFTLQKFAPTGTIMLITLSIILGFQLLLQAIQYDVINSPKAKN